MQIKISGILNLTIICFIMTASHAKAEDRPDPEKIKQAFKTCQESDLNVKHVSLPFPPARSLSDDQKKLLHACIDKGILPPPPGGRLPID